MAFKIYPLCIFIPSSLHFIDHNNNVHDRYYDYCLLHCWCKMLFIFKTDKFFLVFCKKTKKICLSLSFYNFVCFHQMEVEAKLAGETMSAFLLRFRTHLNILLFRITFRILTLTIFKIINMKKHQCECRDVNGVFGKRKQLYLLINQDEG